MAMSLSMTSSLLVSPIVCPLNPGSNSMISPLAAAAIASRSEPTPLSAVVVTVSVAAFRLLHPSRAAQNEGKSVLRGHDADAGNGEESGLRCILSVAQYRRTIWQTNLPGRGDWSFRVAWEMSAHWAAVRVYMPRPWVATTNFLFVPLIIQKSSATRVLAGPPKPGVQVSPSSLLAKTPSSVPT